MLKRLGFIIFITSVIANFMIPSANAEGIPFQVEPVLPDNQDVTIDGYIAINTDGDLEQELEFTIRNSTDKEQEIKMRAVDAYTSSDGQIQYTSKANNEIDEMYKLSEYVEVESDVITLSKNEVRKVKAKVNVSELDGSLLGAVSFSPVEKEETTSTEEGFQIKNEVNVIIGVLINFDKEIQTNFETGTPYMSELPAYYVINFPVIQDTPNVQEGKITYTVFDDNKKMFDGEKKIKFAPRTQSDLSFPWQSESVSKKTKYTLKGEIEYEANGETVVKEFEEKFDFTKQDEQEKSVTGVLNAPKIDDDSFGWVMVSSITFTWVLMGVFVWLIVLNIKKRRVTE